MKIRLTQPQVELESWAELGKNRKDKNKGRNYQQNINEYQHSFYTIDYITRVNSDSNNNNSK